MLEYPSVQKPLCYDCSHARNEYAAKNIRFSIEDVGGGSTNPTRIAQGTAEYNMGLPGVVEEYGPRNAYGQRTILKKRPVHINETPTVRSLRERAKRAGMTLQEAPKRALPE